LFLSRFGRNHNPIFASYPGRVKQLHLNCSNRTAGNVGVFPTGITVIPRFEEPHPCGGGLGKMSAQTVFGALFERRPTDGSSRCRGMGARTFGRTHAGRVKDRGMSRTQLLSQSWPSKYPTPAMIGFALLGWLDSASPTLVGVRAGDSDASIRSEDASLRFASVEAECMQCDWTQASFLARQRWTF
jgi:hypothetical protein